MSRGYICFFSLLLSASISACAGDVTDKQKSAFICKTALITRNDTLLYGDVPPQYKEPVNLFLKTKVENTRKILWFLDSHPVPLIDSSMDLLFETGKLVGERVGKKMLICMHENKSWDECQQSAAAMEFCDDLTWFK